MNDRAAPSAERAQRLTDTLDEIRSRDSHDQMCRARRVGERSKKIENRAHAEFATYRGGVAHRGMVTRRKHKRKVATFSIAAATSGSISIARPAASSTSALPHALDAARLPCFATGIPVDATTSAAIVEMLSVFA